MMVGPGNVVYIPPGALYAEKANNADNTIFLRVPTMFATKANAENWEYIFGLLQNCPGMKQKGIKEDVRRMLRREHPSQAPAADNADLAIADKEGPKETADEGPQEKAPAGDGADADCDQ